MRTEKQVRDELARLEGEFKVGQEKLEEIGKNMRALSSEEARIRSAMDRILGAAHGLKLMLTDEPAVDKTPVADAPKSDNVTPISAAKAGGQEAQ